MAKTVKYLGIDFNSLHMIISKFQGIIINSKIRGLATWKSNGMEKKCKILFVSRQHYPSIQTQWHQLQMKFKTRQPTRKVYWQINTCWSHPNKNKLVKISLQICHQSLKIQYTIYKRKVIIHTTHLSKESSPGVSELQ